MQSAILFLILPNYTSEFYDNSDLYCCNFDLFSLLITPKEGRLNYAATLFRTKISPSGFPDGPPDLRHCLAALFDFHVLLFDEIDSVQVFRLDAKLYG